MKFQEIKIGELEHFTRTTLYKNSKNIPITIQRAISQSHNPRADKADIALIIAINEQDEILGFIGSLPDYIFKTKTKVYWNTCWWIDPKKGKHVAIPLFLKFLKNSDNKVIFRDLSFKTAQIIHKLNKFETIKNLDGYRYFLRLDSLKIISKKMNKFNNFKSFFKVSDYVINTFLTLKNTKKRNNISYKYCKSLDKESINHIQKFNKNELFKRGKLELEWILNYPWVLKDSLKKNNQYYYFTDTLATFSTSIIKVYSNSIKLIGILFVTNNNGLVKIPYVYFEQENSAEIVHAIYQYLYKHKATSFLTYNELLNNYIQQNRNPFWYKKEDSKAFVVSKSLTQEMNFEFYFQDGEGDFVFT